MKAVFKREKKRKREKTPKQKADRSILLLAYAMAALFLCLMGHVGYFLTVSREEVINNPYNNARLDNFARTVERGKILSSDRTVLAMTENREGIGEIRVYPFGALFSHVVGYSSRGKTGLEELGNFYLLSSHMNPVSQIGEALAGRKNPGDQIITTLDLELQQAASDALGDRKGAVVAMEPDTGRVLVMVSKPDFDSNAIADTWESIVSKEDQAPLVNRAVQGLYPPGSIFKILTVLEYIKEHPDDYDQYHYDCDGYFKYGDYTLPCYHKTAHGSQNLTQAFANSCNGAFASLGLQLDKKAMAETAEQLLFNREQPIALAYSQSRFSMNEEAPGWEVLQTAIGQGMTQMTPMHSLMVTAAIANRGVLMNPFFIQQVENALGEPVKRFEPAAYGALMEEGQAEILKDMMVRVVTEGTGSALRTEGYTAAGKTGSAQFETGKETHAWFTGFAPAENPRIAVTVIVEEGGSGGQTAAPVARKIFDVYLGR